LLSVVCFIHCIIVLFSPSELDPPVVPITNLIDPTLYNQSTPARWYQLLKHFLKITCHLFERALDGFVLPLVKDADKLLNRDRRLV